MFRSNNGYTNNTGNLRDAFNRDVLPQAGSPMGSRAGNIGGGCPPVSPGPPAYESATPFGNIGTDGFGNVSTLNNDSMFDQGPSYKLPGVHMGAGSGYGAMGFLSNYNQTPPNKYGKQGGNYNTGNYNTGNYGGNGHGTGNGSGGCAPCQANTRNAGGDDVGNWGGHGSDQSGGQGSQGGGGNWVNDLVYQEGEEDEDIDATHSSVNRQLVKYLRKNIIKLSKQLKIKPDWVDLSPDGGASWKYSSMVAGNSIWCRVFTKVEVHAERKGCRRPIPHICNITTTTKIKLDPELVVELLKEFPMMSYCSSTNNLQLTMDSLEHNLAMLALICSCQQDKISLNHIKYYDLPKKYMLLTTPGNKKYHPAAKYSLIRQIRT